MVARLPFAFLALVFVTSFAACEDDKSTEVDMSVADMSIFIGCDPKQGTQTNPGCPANLPQCHPAAQICVGCIPSSQTCLPGFTCSQDNYTCEPFDPTKPCTRNVDCPQRVDGADQQAIICNTDTGKCQECVADVDCVNPFTGGIGYCNHPAGNKCTAPPDGGA